MKRSTVGSRRRLLAGVVLTVAGLVPLAVVAACDRRRPSCPTTPVEGLAIAVGSRANSPTPVLPDTLTKYVGEVMDKGKGVTVVRVDGQPTIYCAQRFASDARASAAKADDRRKFGRWVAGAMRAAHADVAEADPLRALTFAGRSAGAGGTVVLIDSGLQTVPPLDFRDSQLLAAAPDQIVRELERGSLLPDLHDRRVVLVGVGYTARPQRDLDEPRRARLVETWRKIAEAGGATAVEVVDKPNTKRSAVTRPPVSVVDVPPLDNIEIGCDTESILSDDGAVGFQPGRADFKNPTAAREVLAKFAGWLVANQRGRAELIGSVAHYGRDEGDSGLSRDRAVRVADALVDLGVNRTRVSARGEGWGPFPSKDAPPDPRYDQSNRRVVVRISCG